VLLAVLIDAINCISQLDQREISWDFRVACCRNAFLRHRIPHDVPRQALAIASRLPAFRDGRNGPKASILACPQHVRLGFNLGSADCPVLPVESIGLDVNQAPKAASNHAA